MIEKDCDCKDPKQCWEPCGELGRDEKYVGVITDREMRQLERAIKQIDKENNNV